MDIDIANYTDFLKTKALTRQVCGFKPLWLPDFLFDFQRVLVDWWVRIGRGALFEDCGLGKTPQALVCAENIRRKVGGNVLILTPLAVAPQFVLEGEKFGIEVKRTRNGEVHEGINVTNYHRLHYYNPKDFVLVVCDESSCCKNFDGKTRRAVTDFLSQVQYRLLCTATPAPNDFMELGTSSEALGVMGRNSMLGMFFTNDGESTQKWRLKGHAKRRFWQWLASWARAVRKPSDLGFPDGKFQLPPLRVEHQVIKSKAVRGRLFPELARTLTQQRTEKRNSLRARCERAAEVVPTNRPCVLWCQLNPEADLLEKLIPGAVQVAGSDSDEAKEEKLVAFAGGHIRVLVTKPTIAGFGLNWQHCSDVVYFPSHSHEQFYQALRRCWRFGQNRDVTCNLVHTEAEKLVVANMLRKERQSVELYDGIVQHMNKVLRSSVESNGTVRMEVPPWLR